jgi:hypothetical protein
VIVNGRRSLNGDRTVILVLFLPYSDEPPSKIFSI